MQLIEGKESFQSRMKGLFAFLEHWKKREWEARKNGRKVTSKTELRCPVRNYQLTPAQRQLIVEKWTRGHPMRTHRAFNEQVP